MSPPPVAPRIRPRDVTELGLIRMVGTLAVILPSAALIQVLADPRDYRQPGVAAATWLVVLAAAGWLVPRLRRGQSTRQDTGSGTGLNAGESAAAIAIAVAAVAVIGLARRVPGVPGRVDLAIFGTVWLLALVVISRPARVWVPAALAVFAVHGVLLIRGRGLSPLILSELEAAGYILAAVLIAFAALRPAVAAAASIAAGRAALASQSAAESAAAAAIAAERRDRLAVLEKEALPLLRGIADGTLDPTAPQVRDRCARHAAALRHSLAGRVRADQGTDELLAGLGPALTAARERGLLVTVQALGDTGPVPPPVADAVRTAVEVVLRALLPQPVTLTVLASGDEVELFVIEQTGAESLEIRWPRDSAGDGEGAG